MPVEYAYFDLSAVTCIARLGIPSLPLVADDRIYLGLLHLDSAISILGRRGGSLLRAWRLVDVWIFHFEVHDGVFSDYAGVV